MPAKTAVTIDEVLGTRKDISDDDGVLYKAHIAPRSWNDEERSAVFIMSAETEDSYRDIVVQAGIDTKARFEANPVALFGHKSWSTPIGSWSDVRRINGSPKRTEGKLTFSPEGVDEDADKVARHVAVGTLRASSIGFMPKAAERILDANGEWNYGYRYLETELYECSVVTVPAVREALIRSGGRNLKDIVSPEVIEEFLEHLKANPAIAKMINRDLYEGVYREITGTKTRSILTVDSKVGFEKADLDRMEAIAKRMEAAAEAVAKSAPAEEVEDEPAVDEIAKGIETSIEKALEEFAPKIDEVDEPERKGALTKLMDGIRSLFKAAEPAPEPLPAPADPEIQKALKAEADEIAARYAA
jgi:HK97 family phage prohead protease